MKYQVVLVLLLITSWGCSTTTEPSTSRSSQPLETSNSSVSQDLDDRGVSPTTLKTVIFSAPWGDEEGAIGRDRHGADTGPMAIAANPEGGVSILDTVGGRIYRIDEDGRRLETVYTNTHTADDLVIGGDSSLHLLVYRRTPTPHHEVLSRRPDGEWDSPVLVTPDINLPTVLWLDGSQVLVEQRHEWLFSPDGTDRRWGRPFGDVELRAALNRSRRPMISARRGDEVLWTTHLENPHAVTEILALEVAGNKIALVYRTIFNESSGGGHRTSGVILDQHGTPLQYLRLVDTRVTDSGRPFALGRDGAFYELATDEAGVSILKYSLGGVP